ncbi:protein tyrosine kinase domain-containing protein [Rhizoctonia solani AG-1 IA]|uniref:Protein tyrosine kinase domain-containing protein n=1 Tax=Thanatephorus cucumeris (strain AG1-IA) TaxID=983506 RepID=L8WKF2_THACA|nr:protein tyrosine kinase domain-containing protein [Rhizoctonia solani AG-1 IA]
MIQPRFFFACSGRQGFRNTLVCLAASPIEKGPLWHYFSHPVLLFATHRIYLELTRSLLAHSTSSSPITSLQSGVNHYSMNKLEQILRGFVSFTELAATSGFLPALPAACGVLEQIWGTADQVKILRARCVYIFITIRDNAAGIEQSALNETVEIFITLVARTIKGIHSSMNKWAEWGSLKSFAKNDEITVEIERSMNQLDACCQNLQVSVLHACHTLPFTHTPPQIATQLQLYSLNTQMDAARESDQLEMKKMMLTMLENQEELREDMGLLLVNMEKFTDVMKTFQLELRAHPAGSLTHDNISRGLLGMQQASGQLPPIAFLEGHECKIVSQAPIAGSTVYDVYEGLWLGEEKVAVKILRSSKASEGNVRVSIISPSSKHLASNEEQIYLALLWSCIHRWRIIFVSDLTSHPNTSLTLAKLSRQPLVRERRCAKVSEEEPQSFGLRYLHSQNPPIVHGSLQGSNVLIGDGGGALLADFGLAKALEDLTAVPFTQSTGANGCYRWMAPELHEDGGQMTLKSDIYSWAMTALELYSDKVPYSRIKMPGSVVMEVARGRIPERPRPGTSRMSSSGSVPGNTAGTRDGIDIPDGLWELFVRCWDKDPANRPTIQETIQELEDMRRYTLMEI